MVEYRLYYDDNGKVICYTTEALEGNFVLIDKTMFRAARPDVRVVDNKVIRLAAGAHILKLTPQETGTPCNKESVLVIDKTDPILWDLKVYDR